MEYGSFDTVPPEGLPPEGKLDECSLCADPGPSWWYVIEPDADPTNRLSGEIALARWWEICATCHRLVAAHAVDLLQARLAQAQRPDSTEIATSFVRLARLWGQATP